MRTNVLCGTMLLGLSLGLGGCAGMGGGAAGGMAGTQTATQASATSYLQAAKQAVAAQQPRQATSALDHAETMLLDNAPPPAPIGVPEDPTIIRQIARAREAVMYRKWDQATTYIDDALQHPYIDR